MLPSTVVHEAIIDVLLGFASYTPGGEVTVSTYLVQVMADNRLLRQAAVRPAKL